MPDTGEVREQQRALYGEPLADVVARVAGTLGLNQGGVARVIGLSAPMLSQLVGGTRVKIGNPLVSARFDRLVELAADIADGRVDAAEVAGRLEEVRTTVTRTTTQTMRSPGDAPGSASPADPADPADVVLAVFAAAGSPADHTAAADLLDATHPAVAALLRTCGSGDPDAVRAHLRGLPPG